MGEHFDPHQLSAGARDPLPFDLPADVGDLHQVQFPGQDHYVRPLGEEPDGFDVGDVALRGDMYVHADAAGVLDGSHIGSDDGVHTHLAGTVDGRMQGFDLFVVNHRIDRQIAFHAVFTGDRNDLPHIFQGEVGGGLGPHIEPSHSEINGVGSGVDRCMQGFVTSCRSHDLYVAAFHWAEDLFVASDQAAGVLPQAGRAFRLYG